MLECYSPLRSITVSITSNLLEFAQAQLREKSHFTSLFSSQSAVFALCRPLLISAGLSAVLLEFESTITICADEFFVCLFFKC